MKRENFRFWMKILFVPILTGIVVALIWQWVNMIKPYKIHLSLPYAYEYHYRGATGEDPSREVVRNIPIQIKLDNENRGSLRLGMFNRNIRTIKNVAFFIRFPKGIKVIEHEQWQPWEIDKAYYFSLKQNINNNIKVSFKRFVLGFEEPGMYEIGYTISGEDVKRIERSFFIKAVN